MGMIFRLAEILGSEQFLGADDLRAADRAGGAGQIQSFAEVFCRIRRQVAWSKLSLTMPGRCLALGSLPLGRPGFAFDSARERFMESPPTHPRSVQVVEVLLWASSSSVSRLRDLRIPYVCPDFVLAFYLRSFNNVQVHDFSCNLNSIIMAKALSKSQIAASVADKAQISKNTAAELLDHLADLAYKNAKNNFTLFAPDLGARLQPKKPGLFVTLPPPPSRFRPRRSSSFASRRLPRMRS